MTDQGDGEKAKELADHESRLSKYTEHLKTEDLTHLILRGHIYTEFALIDRIEAELKRPEELNVKKLNFVMKAKLAAAMGLIGPNTSQSLILLNDLRNRLAHKLDVELGSSELEKFSQLVSAAIGMTPNMLIGTLRALRNDEQDSAKIGSDERGELILVSGPKLTIHDFTPQHVLRLLIALLMDLVAPPMSQDREGVAAGHLYYAFFKKI